MLRENESSARRDKTFLIEADTGREMTFAQVDLVARAVASDLMSRGLAKGDRVAVCSDNGLRLACVYFGCWSAGLVPVPVNPLLSASEIQSVLSQSRPKALVVADRIMAGADGVKDLPDVRLMIVSEKEGPKPSRGFVAWDPLSLPSGDHSEPFADVGPDDVMAVAFTSGTTSRPKGLVHTFANMTGNARAFAAMTGINAEYRFYNVLSMAYMAGFYNLLLLPYLMGASVVLDRAFDARSPIRFWEIVVRHQVNALWLVPTIMSILLKLDRSDKGERYCRKRLRAVFVGTAPLPFSVRRDFETRYGVRVLENYGLAETLFISTETPGNASPPGSVGRLLPGVDIFFANKGHGSSSSRQDGDIQVDSPHLMSGYVDAAAREFALQPITRPFPTGDVGYRDEHGNLFITGRKKDVIIRGGVNISPAAVEDVLLELPEVKECAVVGIPHEVYGEEIVALVCLEPGLGLGDVEPVLRERCAAKLSFYQQPQQFFEIDRMPRSVSGKIQKEKLRAILKRKLGLKDPEKEQARDKDMHMFRRRRRIVDLTLALHPGMPSYPTPYHPGMSVTLMATHEKDGREVRQIVLGSHMGTHVDAPLHMLPSGASIDAVPLSRFMGPAGMADLRDIPPRHEIGAEELQQRLGGRPPKRLILRYGWDQRLGDQSYFTDHPYLSEDAARWLVEEKVVLLGMDCPQPDAPHNTNTPVHKILLGGGVALLEYLCNLDEIRADRFELVGLPLKIRGADGSPVRCVAVVEDNKETEEA